jgi:hypothetical protein
MIPNLVSVLLVYEFIELVVVSSEFNLPFCVVFVVSLELVYELKSVLILPLSDSKDVNLPLALDVNVFKLPEVDSIVFNLLFALDVYVFKEDVVDSRTSNLPFCMVFVMSLDELYELKTTSSNLPVPTGTPFNVIEPEMVNAPVISVFVLTLKPSALEIDAVTLPSAIRVKLSPVTPLAGILYKPPPFPINEPVKDPVVYEDVNWWKLDVRVYDAAWDAEIALLVVPEIVAFIVPSTVKSPEIRPEPDTDKEPDINGSKIFIYKLVLLIDKYLNFIYKMGLK